jgi:[ribosomal protein S5]-alanine N-acetyltransferase
VIGGLQTERLELHPLPAAVAAALADDRETGARLLGVAPSPTWPHADLLDILPLQAAAAPDDERFGVWVIIESETATVVGDVGFRGPPGSDRTVEIGYSVVQDRRRRGYATEAAAALVDWVLSQPGVLAVVAGCNPGNVASIRTLEKLGFCRDGEANGELRWRI